MARKEVANTPGNVLIIHTINETIVGRGNGNNKRLADVQLVQFFLRQFYKQHPELFRRLPKTRTGNGQIKIDGIFGGQTETGILLFQRFQNAFGARILSEDGIVNVASTEISKISRTLYTILALNEHFRRFGDGKELHNQLEKHPDIIGSAPELLSELSRGEISDEF